MRIALIALICLGIAPLVDIQAQDRPPALEIQYHRAEAAWKTGASLHEAKARIDRVLSEIPDDVEARKLRAQVLLALERPGVALVDALRAVELRPGDPEARLILCEVAIAADEPALARRELAAAAERIIEDPLLNLRLSTNALALSQLDHAEAFARTAFNLAPRNPHAYYQLARVFVLRNQSDDAAAILERGFRESFLDVGAIHTDTLLMKVARHPSLREFVSP